MKAGAEGISKRLWRWACWVLVLAVGGLAGVSCSQSSDSRQILIPAGQAWVGAAAQDAYAADDEQPIHPVNLPAFYLDRTEVTFDQFAAFIKSTEYRTDSEKQHAKETWRTYYRPVDAGGKKANGAYPVFLVSERDAKAYAEWQHKRLPTEEEWERAARGDDQRTYPWGDEWNSDKCVDGSTESGVSALMMPDFENGGPVPVGKATTDVSPFGVCDMAGNLSEWTADRFEEYPGSEFVVRGVEKHFFVYKGGSWGATGRDAARECRIAWRGRAPAAQGDIYLGFRCARDVGR